MAEEFKPPLNNNEKPPTKKEEHHVLSQFFYEHFLREDLATRNEEGIIESSFMNVKFFPGINTENGKLKLLISRAKSKFSGLFVKKENEFKKLLAKLASRKYAGDEEMLKEISKAIYEFAKANFTREELEERYKENRKDKIPLNEMFDCDINEKDSRRLRVHLIGTSKLTAGKIREGFGLLASKLKNNDPSLKSVEFVTLTSWMIYEEPEFFEKQLGFSLIEMTELDKEKQSRRSEMTREKFIEKYLRK